MPRISVATGLTFLLAAAASAQETCTIKVKRYPDAGKSFESNSQKTSDNVVTITGPDGPPKKDVRKEVEEENYVVTTLEGADPLPEKGTRRYIKATKTVGGRSADAGYHGKTIEFALKDGRYVLSAEGVPDADLTKLAKKINEAAERKGDDPVLPKKPVAVGGTWEIDVAEVAKAFGPDSVSLPDSKGVGRLAKVYERDGRR